MTVYEAITYEDVFNDRFIEPFQELLRNEFHIKEFTMDTKFQERGSHWFNLMLEPDAHSSMRSSGQHREYNVKLRYYEFYKNKRDRTWFKYMMEIGERLKRLIANNSNFTVQKDWVDHTGTWGETTITWSESEDTHCWFDMQIDIDYDPERAEEEVVDKLGIIDFDITFKIEEVY